MYNLWSFGVQGRFLKAVTFLLIFINKGHNNIIPYSGFLMQGFYFNVTAYQSESLVSCSQTTILAQNVISFAVSPLALILQAVMPCAKNIVVCLCNTTDALHDAHKVIVNLILLSIYVIGTNTAKANQF